MRSSTLCVVYALFCTHLRNIDCCVVIHFKRAETKSSIFIVLHFYLYSSNKCRAFYKQLKNEHFTSSNINTHVKGQWVVSLWINTIVQKTQHSRVYILSISYNGSHIMPSCV